MPNEETLTSTLAKIREDIDAAQTCLPSGSGIREAAALGHESEVVDALQGAAEALAAARSAVGEATVGATSLLRERDGLRAEVESKARLLPSLLAEGKQIEQARAETAERERDEARQQRDALAEALRVLRVALANEARGYWRARELLRSLDIFDGDLSENALLAEVARAALAKVGRQ